MERIFRSATRLRVFILLGKPTGSIDSSLLRIGSSPTTSEIWVGRLLSGFFLSAELKYLSPAKLGHQFDRENGRVCSPFSRKGIVDLVADWKEEHAATDVNRADFYYYYRFNWASSLMCRTAEIYAIVHDRFWYWQTKENSTNKFEFELYLKFKD